MVLKYKYQVLKRRLGLDHRSLLAHWKIASFSLPLSSPFYVILKLRKTNGFVQRCTCSKKVKCVSCVRNQVHPILSSRPTANNMGFFPLTPLQRRLLTHLWVVYWNFAPGKSDKYWFFSVCKFPDVQLMLIANRHKPFWYRLK